MIARELESMLAGRATGRRYQIDLQKLDEAEQRELLRLLRDMHEEVEKYKRRARQPWRGGLV